MRRIPQIFAGAWLLLATAPAGAQQTAPAADPVASPRCAAEPAAFGCANAANLAVMASPDDLAGGRPLAAADGAVEAAAVVRLRTDKVKDLAREGSTAGAGGSPQ
jgi:type IV pilus biogenesis protein CpaD/CtpE